MLIKKEINVKLFMVNWWMFEKMTKNSSNEKEKIGKRKEMTIVLKSKPKTSDNSISSQTNTKVNLKRRDSKKKGTRGPSWIG
ncbi:MAG: hypothetical protein QG670_926 [Thermoproteota archaeon]|nr:hypothetical protein [Thermoproteota archaeon]